MNDYEILIPLFEFDYSGIIDDDKIWNQNYDSTMLPKDYVFFDDRIVLKCFNVYKDYPEIDIDFFSSFEKRSMHECKWCLSIIADEAKHFQYSQYLNLLLASFRIYYNTKCYAKFKLCKRYPIHDRKLHSIFLSTLSKEQKKRIFCLEDMEVVNGAFENTIKLFHKSFRTRHALNFMYLGYTEYYALSSFILFITALESFYLPYKFSRIKALLRKRVPNFINDSSIVDEITIDELYKLRSEITHGKIKAELDMREFLPKVSKIQKILTATLKKIFDDNLIDIFSSEETKERYFGRL